MNFNTGLPRFNIIAFRLALFAALIAITHLATTQLHYPLVANIPDKLGHILAFYVLALLADFSFPNNGFGLSKLFPLLGYGLVIEVIQYHLSYRTFSLLDVTADAIGLVLYGFSLLALRYVPLLRRRWNVEV